MAIDEGTPARLLNVEHELFVQHVGPGCCERVRRTKHPPKLLDDGSKPLERDVLASVLAEIAELDELIPRDDLVARPRRSDDRCIRRAGAFVAVQPSPRAVGAQTEKASSLADAVHRTFEDRNVRAHVTIMPDGCDHLADRRRRSALLERGD